MFQRDHISGLIAKLAIVALILLPAFGSSSCTPGPSDVFRGGIRMETYEKVSGPNRVPVPLAPVTGLIDEDFGGGEGYVRDFEDETDYRGVHEEPSAVTNATWFLTAGPFSLCGEINRHVVIPIGGEIVRFTCEL
jgi:hypothetical protein